MVPAPPASRRPSAVAIMCRLPACGQMTIAGRGSSPFTRAHSSTVAGGSRGSSRDSSRACMDRS